MGQKEFLAAGQCDSGSAEPPQTSELVESSSPALFLACCASGTCHRAFCVIHFPTWFRTRRTSRNQGTGSAGVSSGTSMFWKAKHFGALVPVIHELSLVAESRASQGHSES